MGGVGDGGCMGNVEVGYEWLAQVVVSGCQRTEVCTGNLTGQMCVWGGGPMSGFEY